MKARHDFLDNTIGYFDEELEAYTLTMFLAIKFPLILVVGSILQVVLYRLYNRKFHPFKEMAELKMKGKFVTSSKITSIIIFELFLVKPEEKSSVRLTKFTKRRNL